ncbi:MAG: argininosuccinate lyase [Pirellulales bacterium]|nr:argininosuccinate lyase [Pirellulales bacterium]
MSETKNRSLDTFIRLGGQKELKSLEEGKRFFASEAYELVPRYAKVHRAWTVMLVRQGIIPHEQGKQILGVLNEVGEQTIEEILVTYDTRFPKTILQLERFLTDKIGPVVSNINIGRTLPPPHYRLKMREAVLPLIEAVLRFRGTLLDHAEKYKHVVMPGYTHYMHAQPMTFGHYLLGLHEAVAHASDQLEAVYHSINRCDLGCGALAGTSFPVDRELPARLLGFDGVLEHSNFCVAGTDQGIDLACAMTNLLLPMGRTCTEMYTWCTFEWNMLEVSAKISETSSMMPQKRNPCIFEEIRQTVGAVMGCYCDVAARSHNIMWGDTIEAMQSSEDTVPVVKKVLYAVNLYNKTIPEITPHKDVMLDYARKGFATCSELAAILVREKGIPYRVCHAIVGEVVRILYDEKKATAVDLTPEILDAAAKKIIGRPVGLDARLLQAAMDPVKFVEAHRSQGGVAPQEVQRMVTERRQVLEKARTRQKGRLEQIQRADRELAAAVEEILK